MGFLIGVGIGLCLIGLVWLLDTLYIPVFRVLTLIPRAWCWLTEHLFGPE